MKFLPQPSDEIEINLAPIVDVVFLMLIFFVVATRLTSETTLPLELPMSRSAGAVPETAITINILTSGELRSQGQTITELDRWLAEMVEMERQDGQAVAPRILLRAEADTRHADVARVLDAVRAAGIQHAAIATRVEPQ